MRYWLLGGETYYAKGGICDYIRDGNSVEGLIDSEECSDYDCDWFQVFDTETRKVVAASHSLAHGTWWFEWEYSVVEYIRTEDGKGWVKQ